MPDAFVGRLVVLDFFTYCCINCLHILPDLRKIESDHRDQGDKLLVVGVHSAKFANERVNDNISAACGRYNIAHPVVNDAAAVWWNQMGVSCWPTLVLLEPVSSQPIAAFVGEGHGRHLSAVVDFAMKFYAGDMAVAAKMELPLKTTPGKSTHFLNYPGKLCLDSSGNRMIVSDSGNHRVVVADASSGKVLDVIGGSEAGFKDGTFQECRLDSPQGVALLDHLLFIADTENHAIRVADLQSRELTTLCGDGRQGQDFVGGGKGNQQRIRSVFSIVIFSILLNFSCPWQLPLGCVRRFFSGCVRARREGHAVRGHGRMPPNLGCGAGGIDQLVEGGHEEQERVLRCGRHRQGRKQKQLVPTQGLNKIQNL